jgi:hypothetical protein
MSEQFKKARSTFITFIMWFFAGTGLMMLLNLAFYLLTYPSDVTFYTGLFTFGVWVISIIYTITYLLNNLKTKKDEN